MLDIPLILSGGLEGVLCHEPIGPPRPWRPEDHVFGIAIANFAVLAIEHNERNALLRPSATAGCACDGPSNITDRSVVENLREVVFHTDTGRALHVPEPGLRKLTGFGSMRASGHGLSPT